MNNVVDEVLNTSATGNKIKYRITHEDSTSEVVTIDLETPVTTPGTPLNKTLFDSIKDDLNSRLLISSKATNQEADTGTDTSKYIVPSTLLYKLQHLNYSPGELKSTGTTKTATFYDGTQLTNSNTILITGKAYFSGYHSTDMRASLTINGTRIGDDTSINNSVEIQLYNSSSSGSSRDAMFTIILNKATKTMLVIYKKNGLDITHQFITYETLTSITGSVLGITSDRYTAIVSNFEGLN